MDVTDSLSARVLTLEERWTKITLAGVGVFCQAESDMRRLTIRLPDRLISALESRAAEEHRDTCNMIRRILSLELGVSDTEELDEKQNPKLPLP